MKFTDLVENSQGKLSRKDFINKDELVFKDDDNVMEVHFNDDKTWDKVVVWFNGKVISTSHNFNSANKLLIKYPDLKLGDE